MTTKNDKKLPTSLSPHHTAKADLRPRAEVESLREKILSLVDKNPRKAALILTDWIGQPAGAKKRTLPRAG